MNTQVTDDTIVSQVAAIVREMQGRESPLLPILQSVQNEFGYLPQEALPEIASGLNLTRADVYGVASFYHDFRWEPAGRHILKVCRAESCQSMGADAIIDKIRERFGIDFGETTVDRSVTLEPVYCLGLCACSPAAMLDGEVIGRLDDSKINEIAQEVRS